MQITGYEFGRITIDSRIFTDDVIIHGQEIIPNWRRKGGHLADIEDMKRIPLEELNIYLTRVQEKVSKLHQAQENWHRTLKLIAVGLEDSDTKAVKILRRRGPLYGTRPRHEKQRKAFLGRLKSGEFASRGIRYDVLLNIISRSGRETDYLPLIRGMPKQTGGGNNGVPIVLVSIEALTIYLDAVQLEMDALQEAETAWHRTLKIIAASLESKRSKAVGTLSKRGLMKDKKLSSTYARRREFTDRDFDREALVGLAREAGRLDDFLPTIDILAGLLPASEKPAVRVATTVPPAEPKPLSDITDTEPRVLLAAI